MLILMKDWMEFDQSYYQKVLLCQSRSFIQFGHCGSHLKKTLKKISCLAEFD